MGSWKVGDKIVRFGQVYRIFKIKKKIIFFRPCFKNQRNRTLTRSIPVNNIDKTNMRRPIAKKELRQLLKELSQKSDIKKPINITKARGILGLNDVYETAQVLKSLWIEKNDESTNFTKSKEDVFRLSMKHLLEEVALVSGIALVKAREKIEAALEKGTKDAKQNKTQK